MPISKLIWNMSLPIIASMLVQALYNIVDSVFVSRVSEQALTAVSLAFPAQNLMIGLATGTAVGVNALMGRALGAGQRERADKVANHGILLALVGFAISALLGATCSDLLEKIATDGQRSQGLDIADFLLMEDTPQMILARMIERNPVLQTFIDTFGLELVDAGRAE